MKSFSPRKISILLIGILSVFSGILAGIFLWTREENRNYGADLVTNFSNRGIAKEIDAQEKILISSMKEVVSEEQSKAENQLAPAAIEQPVVESSSEIAMQASGAPERISEEGQQDIFSLAVVGDAESFSSSSGYNNELPLMLDQIKKQNTTMVLFTGDLITNTLPSAQEVRNRVTNLKALIDQYLKSKYFIVFGKHDIECGQVCIDAWQEIFFGKKYEVSEVRKLYYSFDFGMTHFVILSSEHPLKHSIDDEQLSWLEADLAKNQKPNKIVFSHVPPVTFFQESARECHDMSCSSVQRDKLMNILKKYKVDAVVSGHEHTFDHKIVDGIDFILSGDTGNGDRHKGTIKKEMFSIFRFNKEHITLEVKDINGASVRQLIVK